MNIEATHFTDIIYTSNCNYANKTVNHWNMAPLKKLEEHECIAWKNNYSKSLNIQKNGWNTLNALP